MTPDPIVGKEVAQKIAAKLKTKSDLMYDHRDYCGTGLTWAKGKFIYAKIYDGLPMETIREFTNEREFVEWLSVQSNKSLSGEDEDVFYRNNQRLTLMRLFDFANSKPNPRFGA